MTDRHIAMSVNLVIIHIFKVQLKIQHTNRNLIKYQVQTTNNKISQMYNAIYIVTANLPKPSYPFLEVSKLVAKLN